MSTAEGGGNIVTDGLVLCLDAANTKSYPRSGTTWRDLSRSQTNGTLVNTTFNASNGGSIGLDGTNDFIDCGNILGYTTGNFSFSYWARFNSLSTNRTGQGPVVIFRGEYRTGGYYDQINASGQITFLTNSNPEVNTQTAAGVIVTGNIYNVTYTKNGTSIRIYVNGIDATVNTGVHTTIPASIRNLQIGTYNSNYISANIRIYTFLNYNRALTAQEVLQSYNATRSRFGL